MGHANLAQTSTCLLASKTGLQESMRRFDAARGKLVAKTVETEQPPVGHYQAIERDNGRFHQGFAA